MRRLEITFRTAMSLQCVIVEDQTMFRQMLHNMLSSVPDMKVVATAASADEGIRACRHHKPGLLVLDLALPDGHGVDVARRLTAANPAAKIVILSGEASTFVCPADLRDSVHAVLDKTQAFDDLAAELKVLLPRARGGSSSVRNSEVRDRLSDREYEIFLLIGRGLISKEIGEKLYISPQTVQAHRRKIAGKLGTTGFELVQVAIKHYQSTLGAGI
jgi:DNA-binding NarL/FixJ family response regulator